MTPSQLQRLPLVATIFLLVARPSVVTGGRVAARAGDDTGAEVVGAWIVKKDVDAVGFAGPHSKLLAPTETLTACEVLCNGTSGCDIFTWNRAVPPHNCFGGTDAEARWANTANKHCVSGCRGAACGAAPPPAPPPPPPSGIPRWVGARPSVAINASAGLPPVPDVEHITVYNATVDGQRNPFGVYNHGYADKGLEGSPWLWPGLCLLSLLTNMLHVVHNRPMITRYNNTLFMSWYNAPVGEKYNKRSVYATSVDGGDTWSLPSVLFPVFTQQPCPECGEENGPWTTLGVGPSDPVGRLYTQSGTQDAGEHHEGIVSVMRRVAVSTS